MQITKRVYVRECESETEKKSVSDTERDTETRRERKERERASKSKSERERGKREREREMIERDTDDSTNYPSDRREKLKRRPNLRTEDSNCLSRAGQFRPECTHEPGRTRTTQSQYNG